MKKRLWPLFSFHEKDNDGNSCYDELERSGGVEATGWGLAYSPSWDLPRQLNAEAKPDKYSKAKTVNVGFRRNLASNKPPHN